MTSSDISFSLVVPCYNEAEGLDRLITRCRRVAEEGSGEIILVDNGSTDASTAILESQLGPAGTVGSLWWIRVETNQGYGFGITSGLSVARSHLVGWTHADLQADPADVLRAVHIADSTDAQRVLIKGRRYGRPLGDTVFTAGMSVFESLLMGRPLRDINAQPTMFSRDLLTEWGEPPADFALDLFALYAATKHGYRIMRFPVIFSSRLWGQSHWNTDFRAKIKFIKRTVDFSIKLRKRL